MCFSGGGAAEVLVHVTVMNLDSFSEISLVRPPRKSWHLPLAWRPSLLSLVLQTYFCDIFLSQRWRDQRLLLTQDMQQE